MRQIVTFLLLVLDDNQFVNRIAVQVYEDELSDQYRASPHNPFHAKEIWDLVKDYAGVEGEALEHQPIAEMVDRTE